MAPRWPQDGPKMAPRWPKTAHTQNLPWQILRYAKFAPAAFCRRRAQRVSTLICQAGKERCWASRFIRRCRDWQQHLMRPANARSWAAKALHTQDVQWLRRARVAANSRSCGGRLGLRVAEGHVAARWDEAIAASSTVEQQQQQQRQRATRRRRQHQHHL